MNARKIAVLVLASLFGGVACYWYSSTFFQYNGQNWALFCGKKSEGAPVQVIGACVLDSVDQSGRPVCSLTNPNTMGTWNQYGLVDAQGYLLTLSEPPQRVVPNKHTPEDFRLWNIYGAAGIGQGQKGPVPSGGLPSCPTP